LAIGDALPSDDAQLLKRLAGELSPSSATALVARLEASTVRPASVLMLLDELESVSAKIARAAIEALPELDRRTGCSHVILWLDLGVALAQSSGATALKYFKDSPLILGLIHRNEEQRSVLQLGLELAEDDPNVSWEYLKASPYILTAMHGEDVPRWLEIGAEVAQSSGWSRVH
jgi:hypothetical protein